MSSIIGIDLCSTGYFVLLGFLPVWALGCSTISYFYVKKEADIKI